MTKSERLPDGKAKGYNSLEMWALERMKPKATLPRSTQPLTDKFVFTPARKRELKSQIANRAKKSERARRAEAKLEAKRQRTIQARLALSKKYGILGKYGDPVRLPK